MTVSQAVQEAVENNLNLLTERYNMNIADARIGAPRLQPNPVLSIGGDHLDLIGTGFNDIGVLLPKQKNVGRKDTDGSVLKSTVNDRNDDQNKGYSDHV